MGFLLFPIYGMLMGLRLAALRAAETPLKGKRAMGLNESDESSVSDLTEESVNIAVKIPNFYKTFIFSWLHVFARDTITISLSARPTSASSLAVVYHSLSFFKLALGVFGGPYLKLHLIQKMLNTHNNIDIADQP